MPQRSSSLYDSAYLELKRFLLESDIHPGQKIPHAEIGLKLGISITPLREALLRLAAEGLLAHERNRGFFVPEISLREAKELYEVRELIEPYMAAKATKSITERQLRNLASILNEYKQKASEPYSRTRLQVDRRFHMEIMRLGDNRALAQIVNQAYDQLIIRRKLEHLSSERPYLAYQEHLEVYKALEMKDQEKAGELMATHIENARKFVLADIERRQSQFETTLSPIKKARRVK